jgi:hypothetical protein
LFDLVLYLLIPLVQFDVTLVLFDVGLQAMDASVDKGQ